MATRKVFMVPTPSQAKLDDSNSINQIVLKMQEHLVEFGWQITENKSEADLVARHAGMSHDGVFECDIAHTHGLYPTFHHREPHWHSGANDNVIQTLRHARAITAPSEWVAEIFKRELNRDATVINWAIDSRQWDMQGRHKAYTLWNKTRADSTCDPTPIEYLAKSIPDTSFLTTFANETNITNLQVVGRQTFPKMREIIQNASLYLATTKETFGIGTLEALACGIPVLGYNWGGTADIIEHGINGYLVEPSDLEGLVTGWKWCMRHRATLAQNARKSAMDKHYSWERVAMQFAQLYDDVWQAKEDEKWQAIKVSVIIPCFNYSAWLPDAVRTIANQKTDFKFEICIVDDGSTDDSFKVALALKEQYKDLCNMIVCHKPNEGVAIARDYGIKTTIGKYVLCLDADDQIGAPDFLQTLYDAMELDPLLGVAYSSLAVFKGNAEDGCTPQAWPPAFDASKMLSGQNCVPTCCMIRRRAYEQTGGYRKHFTPAEDAGLWYSITLLGWTIRKVTEKPYFLYRMHDNSLSSTIRKGEKKEPKWTNQSDAATAQRYPMAAQISPVDKLLPSHPVRNYDRPLISIIIPVGKGHEISVSRALDSVASQTEWRWEAIVINDTGEKLELQQRWPKVINANGASPKGAGMARNLGIEMARGKYLVFLDADDTIEPTYLEKCYQMFRAKGSYVYTDWFEEKGNKLIPHEAQDYSQDAIFTRMSIHAVTVFIPKEWVKAVGGFGNLGGWEDTWLFINLAIQGYCGTRLAEPLFCYNIDSGKRRENAASNSDALKAIFRQKFGGYLERKIMPKRCCGQPVKKIDLKNVNSPMVKVILQNDKLGAETLRGAITRTNYGIKRHGDIFLMYKEDMMVSEIFVLIQDDENLIKSTVEPNAPVAL